MQTIETRRLGVAALLALAVVVLAYVDAQGSPGQTVEPAAEGMADQRSPRVEEAEAAIVRTNLVSRIEAALDDDFAGVWFDSLTATLHVGYISSAARRVAEGVAAANGLEGVVTATPVRFTWAELDAAQARWDERLAGLFERAGVATALSAERNAVTIELGSATPAPQRAAIEREALADDVNVSIAIAPYAKLGVEPQARCAAFAAGQAACNPTIVGGVTIRGPIVNVSEIEEGEVEEEEDYEEEDFVEEGEGLLTKRCTAGPAVRVKDPPNGATATKTYILTAGHCVDPKRGGGGIGAKWNAINKEAPPEEKEIGTTVTFIHNLMDIGVIEVTTNYWAEAKDPPVKPTIAPWAGAETEPYPVIQQNGAAEGMYSCLSGQTTGISCGKIITTDQTTTVRGVKKTNLAEVEKAKSAGGDSGGPWFAESEYKKGTAFVEGTHVGRKLKTGNPVFQPLSVTLPELKKQKGLDLELLTTKNEKRH